MSPVKEPNYFSISVNPETFLSKPIRDKTKYLNLFKDVKNEIAVGEASPSYLWDPKAPELIHEVVPDARIIIMLRDPIERAFSHYLLFLGLGTEKSTFSEAIKNALKAKHDYSGRLIEAGLYAQQIKRYLEIFGSDKIKIIIFEEFFLDTTNSFKQVLEFLGLKSNPPDSMNEIHMRFSIPRGKLAELIVRNQAIRKMGKIIPRTIVPASLKSIFTKKTPKPKIPLDDRKFLEEFYRDDVKNLQKILGRSLPWQIPKI